MKLLSVSDLQRTTDGVKEQQLNQTCFGNLVAPKYSRRPRGAEGELTVVLLCWGEGAPGGSQSPQDRARWSMKGKDVLYIKP